MEWNINDVTEQAALNAQSMVQQWKETTKKRLFEKGGKKPSKHDTKSFSRTDIQNNKKRFLAQLNKAVEKYPEFNTPQWKQYFTTIADVETGGTFNENATSKTSSARGYFQILKPNRSTSNQFEDMFALTKQNQRALLAGLGKDGITKVMQNYTIPEIMALSHFQGVNGAIRIFRGNKGVKDANGVSPYKYLNVFRNKIKNKKSVATIEENTNTSINSDLPFMETPLTALQIAQEYNGFTPQTPIPTSITAEELEIPEINVIPDIAKKELLRKAISQTLRLQASIPQTSKIAFDPRVFIDDINSEIINEEQQNLQNILLQDAINRNVSNSAFRYALANDAQKETGKQDQEIEMSQLLNQTALGGPLFNSRTPIESFQGKKSPLPVVRYDCGGNLFLTGGEKIGEDIIRPLHNKVYNNYEDAVDNNMGPIITGIRKGLRYIKDNISDSIPAGISNCTLTATQWVDPTNPIMSAKTIISNPDSVGYSKINADQVVPGDLLIAKVPGKDSYHTMYVSGFDKEGKPLLDYSRGGMGVEENLRTNIPLEWYTANSDGHTQNLYYRNNKFNKTVLPEIIVTGKKMAEGGNLFQDGGNTLLTQNLPGIVVTRPYPSEQQIKQTIEKEWPSAVGLPQYRITKDPTFTRERTGAGSIEYFNEPSITYRNGTTVQNPNQEPTLLFDPNTNTVEDIKLDLLHHYREYDKEYQKLLLDYTNALIGNKHTASDLFWNSELGEQYRNKYGKDIEKHWDEWDQMVEENINNDQYLTQAIDGSLRSLMASDALREKSNYDTKKGAEASWLRDKYAKRAYNNIIKYLKTSKK